MNRITINFLECEPPPASGYNILWRVYGSSDPYTDAGNFTANPAVFFDDTNPDGTDYEGIIRSDCSESGESGENFGTPVPWQTFEDSGGSSYAIDLAAPCAGIFSSYTISGGTPGDVVTVRASFSGAIQMIPPGLFTRADIAISSPDGTSDSEQSTCWSDSGLHGFTITADTVITMVGTTATVNLSGVVHNSSETLTNMAVSIIDINGNPHLISVTGCRGNSSTGGTC